MRSNPLKTLPLLVAACLAAPSSHAELSLSANDGFPLAVGGKVAAMMVDPGDSKVVGLAADCLKADIERVTGMKSPSSPSQASEVDTVIIGTAGSSKFIDSLASAGKIDLSPIKGKWESFIITVVENPSPGIHSALVIAGSDRRGTAFGVFHVSETIGVSPWVWWSDIAPEHRASLTVSGSMMHGPPSVKYRGIFINDEDWGLKPWAAKTFEPELKDIGPKTYAKVAELLLRLKANYLWPAMHECSGAFNSHPESKVVMDDWAIVMGSSHAEPMLYNNATEWKLPKDHWNYETHPDEVKAVWEKRVQENGKFENTYTIGIRGIHDRPMQGGGTMADGIKRIERVFADQRDLLAKYVKPDPSTVPQIFVPYKEVLPYYQNGLKVPDDVTLVWVDDNHGYIRQLSTPEEQKRSGGAGVYYHHSYWGDPEDYLWLNTTPPALTWEEMHKAYENGARNLWVVNEGDIKPMEVGMEFFLRMAYDITPWDENSQPTYLKQWAARNFGEKYADRIAAVLDTYYRLNYSSKPEHLSFSTYSNNYREIEDRLKQFHELTATASAIFDELPEAKKTGFRETVLYPIRGSALANEMNLNASGARPAYDSLQTEVTSMNDIADGKWRNMFDAHPRSRSSLKDPSKEKFRDIPPALETPDTTSIGIEAEKPTRKTAGEGVAWKVIAGLGRTGDSITLLPTTAAIPSQALLEYDFTAPKDALANILVDCIPTHPLNSKFKVRYAVSIDDGAPQEIDLFAKEYSKTWGENVLRAAAIGKTSQQITAGKHTLKIRPIDPSLVFDKITIDFGDLQPSHLGPPAKP